MAVIGIGIRQKDPAKALYQFWEEIMCLNAKINFQMEVRFFSRQNNPLEYEQTAL